jgi:hypothetical protein
MNVLQYLYIFKNTTESSQRMSLQIKITNKLEQFSAWISPVFRI